MTDRPAIETVFVSASRLFIGLSDRRTFFSVSFDVSPPLVAATPTARLGWTLDPSRTALVWELGSIRERLDLASMLGHPSLRMDDLPDA